MTERVELDPIVRTRLETSIKEALVRDAKREAAIAGLKPGPGTIMLIPGTDPMFFWVGLTRHADDANLLFCVPADEAPWHGATGVLGKDTSGGLAITLRCAFGTWLTPDVLEKSQVVALAESRVCDEALDMMTRIVDGTVSYESEQDDDDPDVADWLMRLDKAACEVARLR